MSSFAYSSSGSLILWVAADENPEPEAWIRYCAFVSDLAASETSLRFLVVADTGTPSRAQRKAVDAAYRHRPVRGAVLTRSALVRGVVTVFRWLGSDATSFSPVNLGLAIKHLKIAEADIEPIWSEIKLLGSKVPGGVETIALAEPHYQALISRVTQPSPLSG